MPSMRNRVIMSMFVRDPFTLRRHRAPIQIMCGLMAIGCGREMRMLGILVIGQLRVQVIDTKVVIGRKHAEVILGMLAFGLDKNENIPQIRKNNLPLSF